MDIRPCAMLVCMVIMTSRRCYGPKARSIRSKSTHRDERFTAYVSNAIFNSYWHTCACELLDAANKAMRMHADRGDGLERKFDALPEASKKRRAIAACKDKDLRAAAGYRSTAQCTSEVLVGYFIVIAKAINGEMTVRAPGKRKGGGSYGGSLVSVFDLDLRFSLPGFGSARVSRVVYIYI